MVSELPIEVDDLVVLLLGAQEKATSDGARIEGITRLEKLAFLFDREFDADWLNQDPEFVPHKFGPFSAEIYRAVELLSAANLITDSGSLASTSEDSWESANIVGDGDRDRFATRNFELTELGHRYFSRLLEGLPDGTEKALISFMQRYGSMRLRQLIRYVYERYPAYTGKSEIVDDVMR